MSVATLLLLAVSVPEECLAFRLWREILGCSAHRRAASPLHVLERNRGDVRPISSPLRNAPPPIAPPNSTRADHGTHARRRVGRRRAGLRALLRHAALPREAPRFRRGDAARHPVHADPLRGRCFGQLAAAAGPMLAIEERRSLGEALIEVVARHLSTRNSCPGSTSWAPRAAHDRRGGGDGCAGPAGDYPTRRVQQPPAALLLLQGIPRRRAQRLAHQLWLTGGFADRCNAMALQNRCAEVSAW